MRALSRRVDSIIYTYIDLDMCKLLVSRMRNVYPVVILLFINTDKLFKGKAECTVY